MLVGFTASGPPPGLFGTAPSTAITAVMLPAMGATSAPDSLHIHGHRVLFFTAVVHAVYTVGDYSLERAIAVR